MDAPVVLAVDGNSLVHRSFHAMAHTDQPHWAVRGLLTQLVAAVDRIRPSAVIVGFDDAARSLRRDRWPGYKANRTQKLPTLVEQLTRAIEVMRELGVAVVVPDGLEADDVLASAAVFARRAGASTVIVTSDRDAFALIDDSTRVLRIINGGVDASPMMTCERLMMLLGVAPSQYRDFAALRGDPSDNLPGVRGVGPTTAARLLAEFGTASAAFDDLERVRARVGAAIATRLAHPDARGAYELNCRVMAMHDDVPLELDLASGTGVLPLGAEVVDAVYRAHNLTWSAGQAVRVLADVEALETAPPRPVPLWVESPPRRMSRPSLPRAPRRPVVEQLSLFESVL
ncbi:MAG: 5'-3' exonuclease [Jatrophihabitantaceae bacterium]